MRLLAAKPEGKRLGGSVQSGLDQTKLQIKLAVTINNDSRSGREVPKTPRNRPSKLDRRTKWRQHEQDGILLGECR